MVDFLTRISFCGILGATSSQQKVGTLVNVQEFLDIRPDALEPLWQIAQRNGMGFSTFIDTMVLTPSPSNNDVDGSQHHSFVVNFDYREAGQEDAERANGVGYYEYFSAIAGGEYSGQPV